MPLSVDTLPAGACDCHTHVIGDPASYPMVAARHYTPGPAPLDALQAHLARHGLHRVVIVQPSVYGTDNRCLLDSLDRLEGAGRGIAVVGDDADAASLRALHARGVRGLRVNVESAGVRDPRQAQAALARWSERVAGLGWHLQLYAALDTIASIAELLARLPVPVVLDHFAMVTAALARDDARAKSLLALLAGGNAYVKLSAPYRIAGAAQAQASTAAQWAAAFVSAAPARVLWGSDWPHTDREPGKAAHEVSRYRSLPAGLLDNSMRAWLPDAALRRQVLVDNPSRLYGF